MVTIKEIAAEAGVSVMTVSNVINNNHARVSAATEQRVREIMEKHHYVPNMAARSLISKSSHIIAVLIPLWYESSASLLHDPYIGQLVGMIEELLREKEYYVMICSFRDAEQVQTIERNWQIDGMILVMPHEDEVTRALVEKTQSPLVVFDRRFDDLPMLSVCLDDWHGGYLAAHYLLEKGHRDIGFAAPSIQSKVIRDRYRGFCGALKEYGLSVNEKWVFNGALHQEGGTRVAQEIAAMEHKPTAVVASEDLIACGIMIGSRECGRTVPDDISVVGFDDSLPAKLISPGLTSVAQDVRAKAKCGVDMLMDAIADDQVRNRSVTLDVNLVERDSVKELI